MKLWRFINFVAKRFFDNDGLYRAAALTFSSLLAIVPLMSVVFTVLSAFPTFQEVSKPVQDFVFENFVPASGKVVQTYLENFAHQASQLSVTGVSFLFLSAILVMYTIEDSLNHIWRVRVRRHGISAFLMYWAILTLTPILMGLSLVMSSYLLKMTWFPSENIAIYQSWGLAWLPFLLALSSFTLVYVAVPNCKVPFRCGFVGAFFAACLFQIAKWLFAIYVTTFDTYELLYGAFAILPLFFLWIYYVWLIILIGAEISHALSAVYDRRLSERLDAFTHALRWLGHLWRAQQSGQTMSYAKLIAADPYGYEIDPDEQIAVLIDAGLVRRTNTGNYILARDLSNLTLGRCYSLLPWKLPPSESFVEHRTEIEKKLYQQIQNLEQASEDIFATPLAQIFE